LPEHCDEPHLPLMQSCLQHCELELHDCPSGLHVGAGVAQVPPEQSLVQHWLFLLQLAPDGEHAADDPQVPATQSPLQQSLDRVQDPPTFAHAGWAHAPAVHVRLQQSLPLPHGFPELLQVAAAHCPCVHVELQQSLASAQACPVDLQASPWQVPAEHAPLQQSLYAMQLAPPARHRPAGGDFPASPW
jgi:hypothetical protein